MTASAGVPEVPKLPELPQTFYLCVQSSNGNYSCEKKNYPVGPVEGKISRLIPVSGYIPSFLERVYVWKQLVPSLPKMSS